MTETDLPVGPKLRYFIAMVEVIVLFCGGQNIKYRSIPDMDEWTTSFILKEVCTVAGSLRLSHRSIGNAKGAFYERKPRRPDV